MATVKQLTAALAAANVVIEEQKATIAAFMSTPENVALQSAYDNLSADHAALNEAHAQHLEAYQSLLNQVETLGSKVVETKPTVAKSDKTFEHEGTRYGFTMPGLNHKGNVISADHVLADPELQATLVKMGSGFIKPVE